MEAAEELAKILGIAFYNQHRAARTNKPSKFGALVDKGLVSEKDVEKAISAARVNQLDVAKILIEEMRVPKEEVLQALGPVLRLRVLGAHRRPVPPDIKQRVSADFLKKNLCAPLERREGTVRVAVEDPYDLTRLDAIKAMNLAPRYEFVVGLRDDILALRAGELRRDRPRGRGGRPRPHHQRPRHRRGGRGRGRGRARRPPRWTRPTAAIVKLCNQIIIDAYNKGASDIHVEPYGKTAPTIVRLRVDGDCQKYLEVPAPHRNALVQRLKIMAKLDIAEKRKPQDGKIRFRGPMGTIELRVATIPTSGGNEDVVMRILAASKPLPLDKMGFLERNLAEFKTILQKPYGICLVVGPTGSGKTTTLHSALGFINTEDMKIWTAEDPVEITQPGLRQVQVHPKIDFTFAAAMRSFLRADPDVIMVGEMRDHETAAIGIEASLTGHLVFSTLHTNSAPETIVRLLDMDIDPFNFADALLGICAQRLVRTLCGACKEEYAPSAEEFAELVEEYGPEHWDKVGVSYSPSLRLPPPQGLPEVRRLGLQGAHGDPRAARRLGRGQAHGAEEKAGRGAAPAGDPRGHDDAPPGRHPEGAARAHRLQAGPGRLHQVGGRHGQLDGGQLPRDGEPDRRRLLRRQRRDPQGLPAQASCSCSGSSSRSSCGTCGRRCRPRTTPSPSRGATTRSAGSPRPSRSCSTR